MIVSPLYSLFYQSFLSAPQHTALVIGERQYSYHELQELCQQHASLIHGKTETVGLLAYRSPTAYAGILGILAAGKAYVPLNPHFPENRNLNIAAQAGFDTLIIGNECLHYFEKIAAHLSQNISLFFPDTKISAIPDWIQNKFKILQIGDTQTSKIKQQSELAYILFTSGSTGIPKGVPVFQSSVCDYVANIKTLFQPQSADRFSQTFDLTFDLSVHDMFVCWASAAALYVLPEKALFAPAKFIKEKALTFWFSVPSVAQFMDGFKMLKPSAFLDLKYSLFCGEALPLSIAKKWKEAAPNSTLVNIYGPTEATIGITSYTLPANPDAIVARNNIVSIGKIFPNQQMKIVDENGLTASRGELVLSGSQLFEGYWKNTAKTESSFLEINGIKWYKTGDEVEADINGNMNYIGRLDHQVKIRGYRVELEEINNAIAEITGESLVHSIAWPVKDGVAEAIKTFVPSNCRMSKLEIIEKLKFLLPDYMIPKEIIYIAKFPLNSNGKIDKLALVNLT